MLVTRISDFSGQEHTKDLPITHEQLLSWELGIVSIGEAMPNLSLDEREFLMTGATDEEMEAIFGAAPVAKNNPS